MGHDLRLEVREGPVHELRIDDRALDELEPFVLRQVVAPRGREVVDDEHLVSASEQSVGEV